MYAESAGRRLELHGPRKARRVELGALKKASRWPPKSQRQQLKDLAAGWKREYEDLNARRRAARDEAGRALTAAKNETATLTDEKRQAETRADTAEAEREGLRGRVRELEALNKTQTEYVTDCHGDRGAELPDLATVEGQSAAWANMRAWQAGEKKRRKNEAAAKEAAEQALADERRQADKRIAEAVRLALETEQERQEAETAEAVRSARQDERDSTQAKIDAAVRLALEGERQEQNRDGRRTGEAGGDDRRPDQGADRPGTEARAWRRC